MELLPVLAAERLEPDAVTDATDVTLVGVELAERARVLTAPAVGVASETECVPDCHCS